MNMPTISEIYANALSHYTNPVKVETNRIGVKLPQLKQQEIYENVLIDAKAFFSQKSEVS